MEQFTNRMLTHISGTIQWLNMLVHIYKVDTGSLRTTQWFLICHQSTAEQSPSWWNINQFQKPILQDSTMCHSSLYQQRMIQNHVTLNHYSSMVNMMILNMMKTFGFSSTMSFGPSHKIHHALMLSYKDHINWLWKLEELKLKEFGEAI